MIKSLHALLSIYHYSLVAAVRALLRNWPLIIGSIGLLLVYNISARLFGASGIAGGLLLGLISAILLSVYYSWISASVDRERLKFNDLFVIDYGLFSVVINSAFILWIVSFVAQSLRASQSGEFLYMCISLGLFVGLNALPEVLYRQRSNGIEALADSGRFTRDHSIEWFIPMLILSLPLLIAQPALFVLRLASTSPLLPLPFYEPIARFLTGNVLTLLGYVLPPLSANITNVIELVIAAILASAIINIVMLFRGYLFRELESGGLRRRKVSSLR